MHVRRSLSTANSHLPLTAHPSSFHYFSAFSFCFDQLVEITSDDAHFNRPNTFAIFNLDCGSQTRIATPLLVFALVRREGSHPVHIPKVDISLQDTNPFLSRLWRDPPHPRTFSLGPKCDHSERHGANHKAHLLSIVDDFPGPIWRHFRQGVP